MSDHSHFEELAALYGGGFLSHSEQLELQEHLRGCPECSRVQREFSDLARSGLPLTMNPVREFADRMKTRPDRDVRSRFLRRARAEGVVSSSSSEESLQHTGRGAGFFAAAATALAAAVIMLVSSGAYRRSLAPGQAQIGFQANQWAQENAALAASLARLNESLASKQREVQNLQAQLEKERKDELARGQVDQSSARTVQLLDEERNQEKLLAEAKNETASINQLRVNDQASLAAQQARITELSYKLRLASATLDVERQLAAAGKDVRELMLSRQLHVIDVRDSDPDGNPGKAFGRVFLTEGKSLTFYAFDLNEDIAPRTKHSFQVWALPEGKNNPAESLGFLQADASAHGRWVLQVDKPEVVKQLSAVFVTVEPTAGGDRPNGQKMLYAYVGGVTHPSDVSHP
jgi:hypothetical protein